MSVESAGRAMSWNLVAKLARFVAMPAGYVVIVRSLGENDWGLLNILRSITAILLVVVMIGGGNSMLRFFPEVRVRGGVRGLARDIGKLALLQGAAWALVLAAARVFGPVLAGIYGQDSRDFTLYLVTAAGLLIFEASMMMITNILQSWFETRLMGIVMVAGNIAYVLLLVLLLGSGWGIPGVLVAGGAVNLMMTGLLLPKVFVLVRRSPPDGLPGPGLSRLVRFSLPFVVTGLLNQIVWRHSEVLFLGHFTGMAAAGHFGLAYRLPQMALEFVPLSIWPIVMAGVSEEYARDRSRLPEAIDLYYRLLFLLVIPVAALGFAFAGPGVPLLFGEAMSPAAPLTRLLFVVFSYSFIYTPLSMALYVMEKSWINMLVFAILALINIGLDLALIPRFGLWGAFFPVAVVMIAGIAAFRFAVSRTGASLAIPAGFIARCYAAVVPAGLLALSSSRWSSPPALAVQALIGVFLLWAGIRITRIVGEREKKLIMRLPLPMKRKIVDLF